MTSPPMDVDVFDDGQRDRELYDGERPRAVLAAASQFNAQAKRNNRLRFRAPKAVWSSDLGPSKNLLKPLRDNLVFARPHHPDGDMKKTITAARDGDCRVTFHKLADDFRSVEFEGV